MPSVSKIATAKGVRYRAEASLEHKRGGKREYKTFFTKAEALTWAVEREKEAMSGMVAGRNVRSLLENYANTVSPDKAGKKWEQLRLALIGRMALGDVDLQALRPHHIAAWRDQRLTQVKAASVRREMNLLGAALTIATKEWNWLSVNPMADVKRPASAPPRDRVYSAPEIERILHVCGSGNTVTARVGLAFRFALETAMRAGEIVNLTWDRVYLERRFVHVDKGKTATAKRDVPLSKGAVRVLELLDRNTDTVFNITSAQLDALFRKASHKAVVEDGTFHDSRHTAATALSDKLDVMELAKMMGLTDLKILLTVYYNKKASDMAHKLD